MASSSSDETSWKVQAARRCVLSCLRVLASPREKREARRLLHAMCREWEEDEETERNLPGEPVFLLQNLFNGLRFLLREDKGALPLLHQSVLSCLEGMQRIATPSSLTSLQATIRGLRKARNRDVSPEERKVLDKRLKRLRKDEKLLQDAELVHRILSLFGRPSRTAPQTLQ